VPQGIISLLTRFGCHVTLAHPEGYQLLDEVVEQGRRNATASGGSLTVTDDMDAAFDGALAVYPKSWGAFDFLVQRMEANKAGDKAALVDIERRALERNQQHRDWICDEAKMARTPGGDALYLHCLPADIGWEVSPGVMTRHKFNVALQAQKKMYVIMALLASGGVKDLMEALEERGV